MPARCLGLLGYSAYPVFLIIMLQSIQVVVPSLCTSSKYMRRMRAHGQFREDFSWCQGVWQFSAVYAEFPRSAFVHALRRRALHSSLALWAMKVVFNSVQGARQAAPECHSARDRVQCWQAETRTGHAWWDSGV